MPRIRPSGWRSERGQREYLAAYNTALELWPVAFESLLVPTKFGDTHVVASGARDAEPLVLLHAATGFGATQWYLNVARLSETFRVCAVDFIGSAGKGTQTKPILTPADCADWTTDVIDGLGVSRANLAGSSQGGWLALNLALLRPERLKALALLGPAASILPFRPLMWAMIRMGPCMGPYVPAWMGPSMIKALVGGRSEIDPRITRVLALHLKHFLYQDRAVFPTVFSEPELRGIAARTLLLIGEHERIYDATKALARARRLIPDVDAELVEGAGHLINMERPDFTSDRLSQFFVHTA